jgi:hypothetical protein
MIRSNDIFALSSPEFVGGQLYAAFSGGRASHKRESFWRSWGLPRPQ